MVSEIFYLLFKLFRERLRYSSDQSSEGDKDEPLFGNLVDVSHLRQILLRLVADVPLESPPMQLNV
jgi:hypothetical protein